MKSTRWAFLALAILASIQVLWWAYLVIHQQSLIAELVGTVESLEKARNYRIMVIFEGAFFTFVWGLGVWYVYRSIKGQITLQEERQSFLSAVTHELKTPLSTIQLSLETITRPQITEEQKNNFINRSLKACKKLFNEIETILTYNESEKLSAKEIFQLNDFINDIKSDLDEYIILDTNNTDALLFASYVESKSILKNIIDNAIKYSSTANPAQIHLSITANKTTVQITVKDNGIGLSEDEVTKIFTPFWRSETAKDLALEGSGLGLTLSMKLAKKNSVSLKVTSSGLGQGTQVDLVWPIYTRKIHAES